MRYLRYLLLISFLTSLSGPQAYAIQLREILHHNGRRLKASDIPLERKSKLFRIGEKITYKINWIGFNAGTITAEIEGIEKVGAREAYRAVLKVRTNDFVSLIFKVEDTYTSLIDTETLLSYKHIVDRKEGRYRKHAQTIFDRVKKKAYFESFTDGSKKEFAIPTDTHDPLSAYYFFRTMDIAINKRMHMTVTNDEKNFDIYGIIDRKGYARINPFGVIEAFRLLPGARLDNEEITDGKVRGYIMADESRIPIKIIIRGPLFTEVAATILSIE